MFTYTHGIIGYLLYIKQSKQAKILAIIGAMIPDLFLAFGYIFHYTPENVVTSFFHNLFHHSFIHTITEIMHSFVFVIPLLIIVFFLYKKAIPFTVGMLSHVFVDLLTHQQGGYNHFFPLPMGQFMAPFSYTTLPFILFEHLFVVGFVLWFIINKRYYDFS